MMKFLLLTTALSCISIGAMNAAASDSTHSPNTTIKVSVRYATTGNEIVSNCQVQPNTTLAEFCEQLDLDGFLQKGQTPLDSDSKFIDIIDNPAITHLDITFVNRYSQVIRITSEKVDELLKNMSPNLPAQLLARECFPDLPEDLLVRAIFNRTKCCLGLYSPDIKCLLSPLEHGTFVFYGNIKPEEYTEITRYNTLPYWIYKTLIKADLPITRAIEIGPVLEYKIDSIDFKELRIDFDDRSTTYTCRGIINGTGSFMLTVKNW
jgi:hypothetical protein